MPPVRVALTISALFVLAVGAGTAGAGNSTNAKQCQKNGWQSLYTRTGESFESNAACTSYAANDGVLLPQAALVCLDDGWTTIGPNSSTSFSSEQECADYVLGGGTPVAAGADISLDIAGAGDIDSIDDTCDPGWRIAVTNAGPAVAVVAVDIAVDGPVTATGANPGWSTPAIVFYSGTAVTLRTSRTIAAGTTATLDASSCGATGSVSVFSSSVADPDSTPGNGFVVGEDDGVTISGSGPV